MSNIVRHPQWPPQCDCGDPQCDGSCRCGPSMPNWSSGFLSCWGQIAQLEHAMTVINKRLIFDPSSGIMDAIIKQLGGGGSGGSVTPPNTNPPTNPVNGQQWFDGTTLQIWDGSAWIPVSATHTTIGPSQPGSPLPGDLWWNGTQMRIWSGNAWNLVGPGATAGPVPTTTRTFAMQQTTALSVVPAGTWEIIPYAATPNVDTQTAWDGVTHRLIPKVAGVYYFTIRLNSSGGGGAALVLNDTGTFTNALNTDIVVAYGTTNQTGWYNISGIQYLNGTSDFVRAWAYNAGGTLAAAGSNPVYQAWLLP